MSIIYGSLHPRNQLYYVTYADKRSADSFTFKRHLTITPPISSTYSTNIYKGQWGTMSKPLRVNLQHPTVAQSPSTTIL